MRIQIYLKTGTVISEISLFASKEKDKEKLYHSINEFTEMEEIKENFNEVKENLDSIEFKINTKIFKSKVIHLNLNKGKKLIKAKDIVLPEKVKILNPEQKILTLKSSNINIKLLLKIEVRI